MKKVLCISLAFLLILGGITVAFAAESNKAAAADTVATTPAIETTGAAVTTETSTATANMTFTGEAIKLSLEDAYKKMISDSPKMEMADLKKQNEEGIAKGHAESISGINKADRNINEGLSSSDPVEQARAAQGLWILDTSNKKMLEANQKYAAAQAPRNYQAAINGLNKDTLENYYTLKELENQVFIAKGNLALKEKLLSNTQLKYKLGTVSKSDVLKAEISVYEAKDSLTAVENGLNSLKMGFNQFMGYGLMQNLALTDAIKEIPLPEKSLATSIKDALANRNEIFAAAYNLEMATMGLDNVKAYPRSSSTYVAAKIAALMAESGSKNAPLAVESDVRTKYMAMHEKYSAIQTGKKAVENAKETERLTQLQYDAGMATLTDVEGSQLLYLTEQLEYSKALLQYNLAVNDYELASTVGTQINDIK